MVASVGLYCAMALVVSYRTSLWDVAMVIIIIAERSRETCGRVSSAHARDNAPTFKVASIGDDRGEAFELVERRCHLE